MQLVKALGAAGALILAAVIGGALIGPTLAQTDDATASGAYCDVFMDALASELGVTREELVSAGSVAAGAALDAAVAAGDVDEDRAAEIRDRVTAAPEGGCGWVGGAFRHGFGHGMARGFLGANVLDAAAGALGVERDDLIAQLRDAESLEELAEQNGASYETITSSILEAVQADLDAAGVESERAEAVLERLTTWLEDGGDVGGLRRGPFGPHRGLGPDDEAEPSGA
jgi:hypothetical protein